MKNVLVRIQEYRTKASTAEQGILDCILANPDTAAQYTIHQLAARAYCSASTIVRLSRKLGFDGYKELQKSLLYEVALRRQVHQDSEEVIGHSGTAQDVIHRVTLRNITALEHSMRLVDMEAVEKSVDLISNSSNVLLFGLGASFLVAQDAQLKFLRTDKPCSCYSDIHSQFLMARNAKHDDVAIIISYSGYTEEMIRCAKDLQAQHTPIIAITRFEYSELSQLATHCLHVVATEPLFRSGAMMSRISQLNMIDILYTLYVERNFSNNVRRMERNQIPKHPSEHYDHPGELI